MYKKLLIVLFVCSSAFAMESFKENNSNEPWELSSEELERMKESEQILPEPSPLEFSIPEPPEVEFAMIWCPDCKEKGSVFCTGAQLDANCKQMLYLHLSRSHGRIVPFDDLKKWYWISPGRVKSTDQR